MSQVEITAQGRKYSTEVLEPWGKGANEFGDKDIEQKFYQNVTFSPLPFPRARRIAEMVRDLENIGDISELIALTGTG